VPESRSQPLVPFLVCQTVCFGVGFIGSQAMLPALQAWYPSLAKPAFAPQGWIFAPVWAVLYFLMGVALFQVWRSDGSRARSWGLGLFGSLLALNALWNWTFFAWNKLPIAFWEIVVLDLVILATILIFNRVRNTAAWLLVPYLAWTCFVTLLTFSVWRMNHVGDRPQDGDIEIKIGDPESGPLLPE
jgi:translocator protein